MADPLSQDAKAFLALDLPELVVKASQAPPHRGMEAAMDGRDGYFIKS